MSLSVLYHSSTQELLYGMLDDAMDTFHQILERRMNGVDAAADPGHTISGAEMLVARCQRLAPAIVEYAGDFDSALVRHGADSRQANP